MQNTNWLHLVGGLIALVMAILLVGGVAIVIKSVALYCVVAIGFALMIWDLILTTRETSDKRQRG